MSKKPAIIIDLDGTLCDTSHRQHFMTQEKKDWDAFYKGLVDDEAHEWCRRLISAMSGSVIIIFVSGRPDNYLRETQEWLHKRGYGEHALFMRKAGDFRKDAIIKVEIYREHIEPYYKILFCVDDRKQVVDAWRSIGLTCLQCAEGNF